MTAVAFEPFEPKASLPPLMMDADGVMRVSQTRVTLETLVAAFVQGASPEEMAQEYPVVPLADIYAVLAFYLRERDWVEAYLAQARRQSDMVRSDNEGRFDPAGFRARLLARPTTSG